MFQLLDDTEEYYIEFLMEGALRADIVARTAAAVQEFMNGKRTLNEWRRMDNENPIEGEGGDTHFVPANLVPLERALKEPEPPPAPVLPASPKEPAPPKDDTQQQRAQMATKAVIDHELAWLTVKEINAVRRAANTPNGFLSTVEAFYARHRETMAKALLPAVTAHLATIGADAEPAKHVDHLIRKHLATRGATILTAAECSAADLPETIRALTETWQEKKGGDDAQAESET